VRYWPVLRRHVFDLVIVAGAVGAAIEVSYGLDEIDKPTSPLWFVIVVQLLLTLPLLARRWRPFAVFVGMLSFGGVISFVDGRVVPASFFTFVSVLAISFLLGMLADRRQALAGLAVALAVATIVANNNPDATSGDYVFIPVVLTLLWLAGLALGHTLEQAREAEERARRAERERVEEARRAVEAERARISRELHDVIAHSVSVMTVQAGAVRRLLKPEQDRERQALESVEETGRQALTEMRRLVGLLRDQEQVADLAPQPGLRTLDILVGTVREAGLPVELTVEGEPRELPAGVDLSAYRVVQEALTNALKYAGPAHAWVRVRWGERELELEVANDGENDLNGGPGGHGLVGMRERVALYGGDLESGERPGGGYVVRARLPIEGQT
jgi:signal transduction histidine kinase